MTGGTRFVRLTEASGAMYAENDRFLQQLSALMPKKQSVASVGGRLVRQGGARLTLDDFRSKADSCGDGNRIDLAYAVYAPSHGISEPDIRAAIASGDLSKKGRERRRIDYIDRTLRKAASTIGR